VFNVGVYIIGCISIVCGFIVDILGKICFINYTKLDLFICLSQFQVHFLKHVLATLSVCPSISAPKMRGSPEFYRIILIAF